MTALIKSIYIHIPFCEKICPFCAFAVLPEPKVHQEYLQLLLKEIDLLQSTFSPSLIEVKSLYFGGGTPSRLSEDELGYLLESLPSLLFQPEVQRTIEVNPEDVTPSYAKALYQLGFNRVSLGVQSFDDACLKQLGRVHNGAQSLAALSHLQQAGFSDINLDFMFGYPGQSDRQFQADLSLMVDLGATHLSAYALSVEPESKIYRLPLWSEFIKTAEVQIADQYLQVIERFATAGYKQYEVSNFAQPGFESRQNLSNWARQPYLGFGVSAHGLIGAHRYSNYRHYQDYEDSLKKEQLPWGMDEQLSASESLNEQWMLELRRPSGINLQTYFTDPQKAVGFFTHFEQEGFIRLLGFQVQLTSKGMLVADELSSHFLSRQGLKWVL